MVSPIHPAAEHLNASSAVTIRVDRGWVRQLAEEVGPWEELGKAPLTGTAPISTLHRRLTTTMFKGGVYNVSSESGLGEGPRNMAEMEIVADKVIDRIEEFIRCPRWPSRGRKLVSNRTEPHASSATQQTLREFGWEVLMHPPYSPDLAPSDFHLLRSLQNFLETATSAVRAVRVEQTAVLSGRRARRFREPYALYGHVQITNGTIPKRKVYVCDRPNTCERRPRMTQTPLE
ncbi:Histone-lysine N-methyltransferase SETMAR [Eumeta japonica]|uniref:Histone-lysine N-methyltransferase SETMAR n=1 Tax=Eumeta variegata TaxID=151549 RepID=A0A4C1VT16_EUMVA|nr:Histone-lysine N-methyltransferase SETMAR [Eumeta japonica]